MYYRRKLNKSGSTSIHVLKKEGGKQKFVCSVGIAIEEEEIQKLEKQAQDYISSQEKQLSFEFSRYENPQKSRKEKLVTKLFEELPPPVVTAVGPELILGKIFDEIGFNKISEELFKDIVLARLTYPVSKLKTTEYLQYHKGKGILIGKIYRFLDRFCSNVQEAVQEIAFRHTEKLLGKVSVLFYDMTTLYFESEAIMKIKSFGLSCHRL